MIRGLNFLTGVTGPQDVETAISFANWDVFWYTRGYPSMNTERSRRHSSKLLTYPITIGSVLHQFSGLTLSNQRLTSEGSRSLAGKVLYIYSRISWLISRLQPSGPLCMSSQVHPRRKSRAPISRKSVYSFLVPGRNPLSHHTFGNSYVCCSPPRCCTSTSSGHKFHSQDPPMK